MTRRHWPVLAGGILALAVMAGSAQAGTVTVNSEASIYDAGSNTTGYGSGSNLPAAISLSGASSVTFGSVTGSLSCSSGEGCIEVNVGSGNSLNDPDGVGAGSVALVTTSAGSISGIKIPDAGGLVGVFVASGGPSGPAPTALDFTSTGTSFSSLSPAVDQAFFIGDGLTGDGGGNPQQFNVPGGATTLYLGLADACNYNGGPGCYNDNTGSYSVAYSLNGASSAPEPASLAILASALVGVGFVRHRRGPRRSAR